MTWGAVAVIGGAIIGGVASNSAAKKGASAQTNANNANIIWQQQQYAQDRADRMPWMDAGRNALAQMQALNSGDFSSFYASPDYTFARDQGLQGIDRSAAARGAMFSGGADADRMRFASGLASQNYGTFYSRLSDLATGGNATAASLGANGMNMAQNTGNLMSANGAARASSYQQQGNNWAQLAGGLGNMAGYYLNSRNQAPAMNGGGYGASGMYYPAATTSSGANWTNAYGVG